MKLTDVSPDAYLRNRKKHKIKAYGDKRFVEFLRTHNSMHCAYDELEQIAFHGRPSHIADHEAIGYLGSIRYFAHYMYRHHDEDYRKSALETGLDPVTFYENPFEEPRYMIPESILKPDDLDTCFVRFADRVLCAIKKAHGERIAKLWRLGENHVRVERHTHVDAAIRNAYVDIYGSLDGFHANCASLRLLVDDPPRQIVPD